MVATVAGQPPHGRGRADAGRCGRTPVYGAFVSLKRDGQLRSCCGFFGQTAAAGPRPLEHAAAARAPKTTRAFRPSTPTELTHLDMDVWLLWGLAADPRPRQRSHCGAIVIGRHGLQIARGPPAACSCRAWPSNTISMPWVSSSRFA